jgi:hypothetical protein
MPKYRRMLVRRGVTIGLYAFIGAGAVIRGEVADYALMLGVSARLRGWMSRYGHRLFHSDSGGSGLPGEQLALSRSQPRGVSG